jgi:hypothetical protein
VAAALAAAPVAALADGSDPAYPGSVLHVAVKGPRVAHRTLTIVATGHNAPDSLDVHVSYGLDVILVDPNRLHGPCRQSYQAELTDIINNPGDGLLLTYASLNEGVSGSFRIPLRFTPRGHGPMLVCAYSKYITDDAAHASTRAQIAKPPPKKRHRRR